MCYFRDLVRSKEPFQICRYFTATLQLVRQTLYSFSVESLLTEIVGERESYWERFTVEHLHDACMCM